MVIPLIIGFSGVAGSGKDEAAAVALSILESAGAAVTQYSFAYPLKGICNFVFDMTEEEMTDRDLKEQEGRFTYGMTNRKIMQLVGTEAFRQVFDENIWIDVAERNITKSGSDIVIISDVRFENEAKWVKENGFLFDIDPTGREGFEVIEGSGHASEAGYETVPSKVIENDVSLEEFHQEVAYLIGNKVLPTYEGIKQQIIQLTEEMSGHAETIKNEAVSAVNEDI